jgi:hypothetical protein
VRASSFDDMSSEAQLLKSAPTASSEIIVMKLFNVGNVAPRSFARKATLLPGSG